MQALVISFVDGRVPGSVLADLRAILGEHPGSVPVVVRVGRHRLLLGARFSVEPSWQLEHALSRLGIEAEETLQEVVRG